MKRPIKAYKKFIYISLCVFLLLAVTAAVILIHVHSAVDSKIYTNLSSIPERSVAIVFGAQVNQATMKPSNILADRLRTGADLYKYGKVRKIVVSGDNRFSHYNEPEVMQSFLVDLGVPEEDIVFDYAGRRTYDTCYRAKHIFGIDDAILVTQTYHLYRAIYTCDRIGIDTVGASSDLQDYRGQTIYNIREIPATILAFIQVNIEKPQAQIMGERLEIF